MLVKTKEKNQKIQYIKKIGFCVFIFSILTENRVELLKEKSYGKNIMAAVGR